MRMTARQHGIDPRVEEANVEEVDVREEVAVEEETKEPEPSG